MVISQTVSKVITKQKDKNMISFMNMTLNKFFYMCSEIADIFWVKLFFLKHSKNATTNIR